MAASGSRRLDLRCLPGNEVSVVIREPVGERTRGGRLRIKDLWKMLTIGESRRRRSRMEDRRWRMEGV
jgi:hypothetical protein